MPSEFLVDLIDHKRRVAGYMQAIANELFQRAVIHDNSKFSSEEYEAYDAAFPEFKKYAFGTDEMKAVYKSIELALQHHFQENRHHPEHFQDGIDGMTLIDILEMACDWLAASHRSSTGISKGLQISKDRYAISDQLFGVIEHTIEDLVSKENKENGADVID